MKNDHLAHLTKEAPDPVANQVIPPLSRAITPRQTHLFSAIYRGPMSLHLQPSFQSFKGAWNQTARDLPLKNRSKLPPKKWESFILPVASIVPGAFAVCFREGISFNPWKKIWKNVHLGGAFKYLLCSPRKLGKDSHFDVRIFFKWVGEKPPTSHLRNAQIWFFQVQGVSNYTLED